MVNGVNIMSTNRQLGLLNTPTDNKNLIANGIGALGIGLMNIGSRTGQNPVLAATQAFQQANQQSANQETLNSLKQSFQNLPPEKKAAAMAIIQSGDVNAINTMIKNFTSPINVASGSTLIDPMTNKPIYTSPSSKTTNAIINAEALGLKPGTEDYNNYIREQTVGRSTGVFQKNELAFAQQVANDTGLEGADLQDAIEAYKTGSSQLPDGRQLKTMTQTAREKLDAINKARTTAALVTTGVQANQADQELKVFDPYIKKGNQHYGDTIMGYSPQFESDSLNAIKGDKQSIDRLSDYYTAQILNFDKAQAQIRIAMANPSVSTTEDLMKLSNNIIKQFAPIKSGEVRNQTIDKLGKALTSALAARNKYGIGASGAFNPNLSSGNGQNLPSSSSPNGGRTYDPATGAWS